MVKQSNQASCSFCGKGEGEVMRLISGPGVFICNECVELCTTLLGIKEEHTALQTHSVEEVGLLAPHEIKAQLDQHVIGQEQAKRVLAVAVQGERRTQKEKTERN
jgi:ATP-dependent Clp protease ATP-binding subunit ClpX